MSERTDPAPPRRTPAAGGRAPADASPWGWLLLVPLLAVLYPPLYNRTDPALLGLPFFYWYQLAVIPVSVLCTLAVYRAGRSRRDGGER